MTQLLQMSDRRRHEHSFTWLPGCAALSPDAEAHARIPVVGGKLTYWLTGWPAHSVEIGVCWQATTGGKPLKRRILLAFLPQPELTGSFPQWLFDAMLQAAGK